MFESLFRNNSTLFWGALRGNPKFNFKKSVSLLVWARGVELNSRQHADKRLYLRDQTTTYMNSNFGWSTAVKTLELWWLVWAFAPGVAMCMVSALVARCNAWVLWLHLCRCPMIGAGGAFWAKWFETPTYMSVTNPSWIAKARYGIEFQCVRHEVYLDVPWHYGHLNQKVWNDRLCGSHDDLSDSDTDVPSRRVWPSRGQIFLKRMWPTTRGPGSFRAWDLYCPKCWRSIHSPAEEYNEFDTRTYAAGSSQLIISATDDWEVIIYINI